MDDILLVRIIFIHKLVSQQLKDTIVSLRKALKVASSTYSIPACLNSLAQRTTAVSSNLGIEYSLRGMTSEFPRINMAIELSSSSRVSKQTKNPYPICKAYENSCVSCL